ncbi:hypothetical protein M9H77_16460 [Catharanthus roseus]|uniref:Uncharacterized protein n=1 Tax=Catharanthus roseus TaxID=4058 RepID=A0ACC0B200_CATRO|nr:hypothetical protein M9H77_16460 [Catharanthus roseus]
MNIYVSLLGSVECVDELIKKTYWEEGPVPYEHWLDTPNHLYVIANTFNFYMLQMRDGYPLPPVQVQWQYHRDVRSKYAIKPCHVEKYVRCPPNLISCHHIQPDQHPANSFTSMREACPRFLYRYASVAAPYANFPENLTSFTSSQSFEGTMLPLLSVNSKLPSKYCM